VASWPLDEIRMKRVISAVKNHTLAWVNPQPETTESNGRDKSNGPDEMNTCVVGLVEGADWRGWVARSMLYMPMPARSRRHTDLHSVTCSDAATNGYKNIKAVLE